ncbi:MAG: hypothetical protein ACREJ3_05275 [Polyangiaceae bacterium]
MTTKRHKTVRQPPASRRRKLTESNVATVPDAAGAYVLYAKQGAVVYVESATSLRKRLSQHRTTGRVPAESFTFWLVPNMDAARELEQKLIERYEPSYNVTHAA